MTGREVYNAALVLMNEVGTSNYEPNTEEYDNRIIGLINHFIVELAPFSDTFASEGGIRDVPPVIASIDDSIPLDDGICRTVMPLGIAAELKLGEDNLQASFHNQRYEELKMQLARGVPQEFEFIEDCYGIVNQYDAFGRW